MKTMFFNNLNHFKCRLKALYGSVSLHKINIKINMKNISDYMYVRKGTVLYNVSGCVNYCRHFQNKFYIFKMIKKVKREGKKSTIWLSYTTPGHKIKGLIFYYWYNCTTMLITTIFTITGEWDQPWYLSSGKGYRKCFYVK